jgi:hypothetical protein
MSFWRDAGRTIAKYSEKIVEKTEEYTKIAKLLLDIKKIEDVIEKLHFEIGEYVITKSDEGAKELSLNDEFIINHTKKIHEQKELIVAKKKEMEEVKKAGNADKTKKTNTD